MAAANRKILEIFRDKGAVLKLQFLEQLLDPPRLVKQL
jgi:hypothetical protein